MLNKKGTFIFVILSLILISQCILNPERAHSIGPFEIKIFTDKEEYLTREPISVRYEVENITDSSICLALSDVKESFSIIDESGKECVNNAVSIFYAFCPDTLKPNQTFYGSEEIAGRFQIRQPGAYTCFINFYGSKSNLLRILIKEPTENEKNALDLYSEAEKLAWGGDKNPQKREIGFQKYLEVANRYPNSVYAPQSLASAILIYVYSQNLENRRKLIPLCRRLIEDYPNSLYFESAFMSLTDVYEVLKDKSGAMAAMNELIEKHPDTRISEEAKRRLEQIEKWKF